MLKYSWLTIKGYPIDWLNTLLRAEALLLLTLIVALVGIFSVVAIKAYHRHQ